MDLAATATGSFANCPIPAQSGQSSGSELHVAFFNFLTVQTIAEFVHIVMKF
jgi:hypothetical protein